MWVPRSLPGFVSVAGGKDSAFRPRCPRAGRRMVLSPACGAGVVLPPCMQSRCRAATGAQTPAAMLPPACKAGAVLLTGV
ncbi:hypothetical protein Acsp01_90180 [Actinoplanes sp. NBRC 101535]|nr:hypothetical protein Acsp01_90180 [Actinoplanes sp. NBRC 101535]